MIVQTVLQEEDYLTYLLYSASRSKRSRANRRRSWLVITGIFLVAGFFFNGKDSFYSYYFFGAAALNLFLYPLYQRYAYKKHYRKFVAEKLAYRAGKECIIDFGSDIIETKDLTGESKFNVSEVAEIIEISTHYFVKLKSDDGLIIPKTAVDNPDFGEELLAIFDRPEIVLIRELDWKWK
jgi:hypothetical protein